MKTNNSSIKLAAPNDSSSLSQRLVSHIWYKSMSRTERLVALHNFVEAQEDADRQTISKSLRSHSSIFPSTLQMADKKSNLDKTLEGKLEPVYNLTAEELQVYCDQLLPWMSSFSEAFTTAMSDSCAFVAAYNEYEQEFSFLKAFKPVLALGWTKLNQGATSNMKCNTPRASL